MASFRELIELAKKSMTIEAQQQLVELQEAHLATREENVRLREEIAALRVFLADKGKIDWEPPFYFKRDGDTKQGPYCQKCYDADGKLVRLQTGYAYSGYCLVCKLGYD